MTRITLEECWGLRPDPYDKTRLVNTYLGKVVIDTEDLTPEFLAAIRADKDDKLGWKRHRKAMKAHGYILEL